MILAVNNDHDSNNDNNIIKLMIIMITIMMHQVIYDDSTLYLIRDVPNIRTSRDLNAGPLSTEADDIALIYEHE